MKKKMKTRGLFAAFSFVLLLFCVFSLFTLAADFESEPETLETLTEETKTSETATEEASSGSQTEPSIPEPTNYAPSEHTHTAKVVVTKKASFVSNGKKSTVCSACGAVISRTVIPKVSVVYLSHSEFTYNGEKKTPSVTVRDFSGKTLKNGADYTLTYSKGRKQTGKYNVTVTLRGENYSGKKVLSFKILPANPSKLTLSLKNNTLSASWSKIKSANGYRVYLFKENSFVKSIDTSKTKASFKKLSKGARYKIVVRSYKKLKKEKLLSTYTASKTVLTTPAAPVIKSVRSRKGTVTLGWKEQKYVSGYTVYISKSPDSGFEKLTSVGGTKNTSLTVKKGLKKGGTYYFKLKAYKKANGLETVRSAFSKTVKVKVK